MKMVFFAGENDLRNSPHNTWGVTTDSGGLYWSVMINVIVIITKI